MAENLMNSAHKASNPTWRDNYEATFRDPETDMEQVTAQLIEIITGEPHKIVDKRCYCSPGDCDCEK